MTESNPIGSGHMDNPITHDDGSDSDDLQALFDSIAAGAPPSPSIAAPASPSPDLTGDSDDLQALFDSVSANASPDTPPAPSASTGVTDPQEVVFNRLGHLARQLHESLRGLGVDKLLEDSARQIPDARERLTYIAQMTEQAASRVLNATDIAKPLQDELIAKSEGLAQAWEKMFANQLSVDEFKTLATDTRSFFLMAPASLKLTNEQLTEIMMAQDFQDLTGQVIKKVVDIVQGLESQLLNLLLEAMPEQRKAMTSDGLLNGPVISKEGRTDIVEDQAQVDSLLDSLGF